MSDESRHLTGSDFERVLNGPEGADASDTFDAAAHMAQCAQCGLQMESYRNQQIRLRQLRTGVGVRASGNCPSSEELMLLASGAGDSLQADPAHWPA